MVTGTVQPAQWIAGYWFNSDIGSDFGQSHLITLLETYTESVNFLGFEVDCAQPMPQAAREKPRAPEN